METSRRDIPKATAFVVPPPHGFDKTGYEIRPTRVCAILRVIR